MQETLPFAIGLIALIVLLVMLASKLKVAYPILLVLAGLIISFIPGVLRISINPDMIFFIFLPALLFEAAWSISLNELKKWYRIIGSFVFILNGLVFMIIGLDRNEGRCFIDGCFGHTSATQQ